MICQHPERARIELAISRGAGRRAISVKYDVGEGSVRHHWNKHVPEAIKAAKHAKIHNSVIELEKLVNEEETGLLEHLQRIRIVSFE